MASLQAGIVEPVAPHDLRRGAARDIARLPKSVTNNGNATVRTSIGHSRNSYTKGSVDTCLENMTSNLWNERANHSSSMEWDLKPSKEPYRKRRLKTAEIDLESQALSVEIRSKKRGRVNVVHRA